MILRGKFGQVTEPLIYYRLHKGQSTKTHLDRVKRMQWFDPTRRSRIALPTCIILREYFSLIQRAPLTFQRRFRCYLHIFPWMWKFRFWLYDDFASLFHAELIPLFRKYLPWTRPLWHLVNAVQLRLRDRISQLYHPRRGMGGWEVRQPPD
jgi:hypothetical protein